MLQWEKSLGSIIKSSLKTLPTICAALFMTFKVHQEAQQSTTSLLIEFSFCDKVLDKTLAKKLLFKERKTSKRRENVHQLYADWLTDYSTWVGPQATSKSFGIKVTFLFMERPVQNVMVRCYSTRKSDQNELLSSQIRWKLAIIANQNWVIFANICIQHWLWKGLWKNGDNSLVWHWMCHLFLQPI